MLIIAQYGVILPLVIAQHLNKIQQKSTLNSTNRVQSCVLHFVPLHLYCLGATAELMTFSAICVCLLHRVAFRFDSSEIVVTVLVLDFYK